MAQLNPEIALGFKPNDEVIVDPLRQQLQRQQLANSKQANTLGAIHVDQEKMKAEEMKADKADQDTLADEFRNPQHLDEKGHFNWDSFRNAVKGKVRLRNLQKLDADHLSEMKAIQDLAAADRMNNTSKMQQLVAHNTLIGQEIAGMQALPDADKPAFYKGSLARLKAAGVDVSNLPEEIPGDGSFNDHLTAHAAAAGYQGRILSDALKAEEAERKRALAKRADQQTENLGKEEDAKEEQRNAEKAAKEYLLVSGSLNPREAHRKWYEKWATKVPALAQIPEYDPGNQEMLDSFALGAKERVQAARDAQKADQTETHQANQDEAAKERNRLLRDRANGQGPKGETARGLELSAQKHDELQKQEQNKWAQHGKIWDAISQVKDEQEFHDPRHNTADTVKMTPQIRNELKSEAEKIKKEAEALAAQQKGIRQRHGGGEFAPKGGAAPAAGPKRARNPKTGEVVELDPATGEWKPVAQAQAPASGGIQDVRTPAAPAKISGRKSLFPL